jgi:hypothetical protein
LARISTLVGFTNLHRIAAAGGKLLVTNLPPGVLAGNVP